jgi:hypothetical protein
VGEYQRGASRLGANYPCQYLALAECGCGPPDMYTFGLPDPTGPCDPHIGTCPLLCEDAGPQYAFPATFSYWEGRNGFNSPLFYEGLKTCTYQLDIYIKGVDT